MEKRNILLIDDEAVLLNNIKFILSQYADQVYTAANGLEGWELLQKEQIHCVICDITMPVMNGIEFIKKVRAHGINIPVIFYSGFGNHEMLKEAIKYGAFDFLHKPDFHGLEEVVMRGLSNDFTNSRGDKSESEILSEYQQMLQTLESK